MKTILQAATSSALRYVALALAGLLLATVVAATWVMTDDLSVVLDHVGDYGGLPSPSAGDNM